MAINNVDFIIPTSLTDCIYFLNGNCRSGDKCRYRHCRIAGEQTNNCRKWPKMCKNVNCPYRHPSILRKQASPSLPLSQVKQRQEGVIALFWDLENVSIPRTESPFDIVQRLRQVLVLTPGLREVGFTCYCDASVIPQEKQLSLSHANVRIAHVPDRKSGGADRQILLDLDRFEHAYKPPGTIVLISGDIDFVGKLSDLRHRAGFHIIVVHNKPAKEELKSTANTHYRWDLFTSSTEMISPNNFRKNEIRVPIASVTSRKLECPLCSKDDFNSLEALRMHQNTKQHFIECPECDDCFFTIESQQQHYKAKHLNEDETMVDTLKRLSMQAKHVRQKSEPPEQEFVERFTCPQCSASNFTSISALQQHQEAKSHTFDCPECDDSYFTLQDQQQHQLEAHTDQTPSKEKLICRICPPTVTFVSMNALRRHILMNGHGYRCPGCEIDTFFTGEELMSHAATCIAAQQFLCPTCNELYCNEVGLRIHQVAMNHFDRPAETTLSAPTKNRRGRRR
ncbi:unnamed protein product [Adineta steineri]|uniref:Uncharacterized protein n=1 Tax=Adineta steineri TaxID=433720 RepID=A0A819JDH2_9BILA|nr:unnamed protein product [Adineta steineri]CAF3928869.1 unnamed protein product [Adineta steineri]